MLLRDLMALHPTHTLSIYPWMKIKSMSVLGKQGKFLSSMLNIV